MSAVKSGLSNLLGINNKLDRDTATMAINNAALQNTRTQVTVGLP